MRSGRMNEGFTSPSDFALEWQTRHTSYENSGKRVTERFCPNCGAPIEARLTSTKMVDCSQCETTVLLADDGLTAMGKRGVMTDHPSLIRLHQPFRVGVEPFHPMGHARFSYGRGWWDEWWCDTANGMRWVSVDEGDYAVEEPLEAELSQDVSSFQVGQTVKVNTEVFRISERGMAVCEAVRGEFPELMRPGATYDYWHLSGVDGRLITVEVEGDEIDLHEGRWLDPFEIQVTAA